MKSKHLVLDERLRAFADEYSINSKGRLSLVIALTRALRELEPPFLASSFLTKGGGQVAGISRSRVKRILSEYGIERTLSSEGGRTSRGSILHMHRYIDLLNRLAADGELDLEYTERWWVEQVNTYFRSLPLKLKLDKSRSLRSVIAELMQMALTRQRESGGTMVAGAVLQHLVGAKLELALPQAGIEHSGYSVADAPRDRKGDFLVGDTAIHVTVAPSEGLLEKCGANIGAGLRPVIITTDNGAKGAEALAENAGLSGRIDVLEIEQFIATNVYEWCGFKDDGRSVSIERLVDTYNSIVREHETDPSLCIEAG